MTDVYLLLTILTVFLIIILLGVWAYCRSIGTPPIISTEIFPEVLTPPPKVVDADRERRARIARLSSIGNDSRRF